LQWAGNQAAEQADGQAAGCGATIQMPQTRMEQSAAQQAKNPMLAQLVGMGQVTADELSHSGIMRDASAHWRLAMRVVL
jgi:predicted flap endonuclease-1-like 5' DNA nuclease